jgi:lysozyme
VDFTFNLMDGWLQTLTLRQRANQQDQSRATSDLRQWVFSGGKILLGLVARREVAAPLQAK